MLQSKLFTKTIKTAPKDEASKNAILLQRAGFINKEAAGVYTFLPLGLLVIKKIENIIREEMLKLGATEILMPSLTKESSWQKTGRADMDVLFHLKGRDDANYVLNPTHEEVITPLACNYISSYKDLPLSLFQFQDKFRNEPRAKSGLLRVREFIMKDLYSFHTDTASLEKFYEKAKQAYFNIFEKVGIKKYTYLTFASGGAFSKYSHEFQAICDVGEDIVYVCEKCDIALNKEIVEGAPACPVCGGKELKEESAVEVGNIFKLGTKFSAAFDLKYKSAEGKDVLVEMGCYGIGLCRLMGILVELFGDEKGIVWPETVSPFKAHFISLGESEKVKKFSDKLYETLLNDGVEVLYDDRADKTAGEKFADSDLIGIPYRVVISEKTIASNKVEIKKRNESTAKLVKVTELKKLIC